MDEKLCLWLEDFDNPELDPYEQSEVFEEQVSLFNEEHSTEYRIETAMRIYQAWKRKIEL